MRSADRNRVRRPFRECCRKGPAHTPRADNENLFHASPPWPRCVAPFPGSGAFGQNDYELHDRIACEGEVEAKLGWLIPFICRAKAYRQSRCCIRPGRRCLTRSSRHAIRAEGSVPCLKQLPRLSPPCTCTTAG